MATGRVSRGVAREPKGAVDRLVGRAVEGGAKAKAKTLLVLISLLLAGLISVSSCASGGAPFQAITEIPKGKALVYLYRPPAFLGGGPEYDVAAGDERIATLAAGSYYPYFANPGRVDFWGHTKAATVLTAEMKAGEVYYLRAGIQRDIGAPQPSFELVAQSEARGEIAKCRLAAGLE